MKCALLSDRNLVRIDGEGVVDFLQNLVTCDMEKLSSGDATFGALLTPQGKIQFDFFCVRTSTGFLFDIADHLQTEFVKRMTFYKLRTPVDIAAVEDGRKVYAIWDGTPFHEDEILFVDPRNSKMGFRAIVGTCDANADGDAYFAHRVAVGMPEGGSDFAYGDAFPHDAMMDRFSGEGSGVAFDKGCYVGQEVVSRMKHRGTARRRIVKVSAQTPLAASGSIILCDEKAVGTLGSVSGNKGLAMVRIDRLAKAVEIDEPVLIDGLGVDVTLPEWTDITLKSA